MERGIRINLLAKDSKTTIKKRPRLAVLLILFFIGVGLIFSYYNLYINLAQHWAENERLKAAVKEKNLHWDLYQTEQDLPDETQNIHKAVEALEKAKVEYSAWFSDLPSALPEGVRLTRLEAQRNKVLISGYAPDLKTVAVLLSCLRENLGSKNIYSISSELTSDINQAVFTLEMDWGLENR
ncbi:MAG: PilN domain-containing protein [Syntrophomonadaceae bacterium]|jgi:Tfp pilus assembly protein PilN